MRPEPVTIALSGKPYTIKPLTLGQLRKIEPVLVDPTIREVEKSIRVIQIALERDHPEVAADIDNQVMAMTDVAEAMQKVLLVGGMVVSGEPPETQSAGV